MTTTLDAENGKTNAPACDAHAYNYARFKSGMYDFETFGGPDVGDTLRDAELETLDGRTVRLSDFLDGKPFVLETGSLTCPMYGNSAPVMQALADKHGETFNFAVMYVREAHPGERGRAHTSMAHKHRAASRSADYHGDQRTMLIDSVDGRAHKLYGAMPNSIFVFDASGTVVFRSIWNNAEKMDPILSRIANGQLVTEGDLKPQPPFNPASWATLFQGGLVSIWDFVISLFSLIGKHRKRGNM